MVPIQRLTPCAGHRNVRVRAEYATMLFQRPLRGVHYCFFLSDKLEPYIIVTAVDPVRGRLPRLTLAQTADLREALDLFKTRYGITSETYHYTPAEERADAAAHCGGALHAKAHSAHFHLKMRIATAM